MLALRAIELRDQCIYDSPLNILRAAMVALPTARRRRVRAMSEVPWFEPLINSALKDRHGRLGEETPICSIVLMCVSRRRRTSRRSSGCFVKVLPLCTTWRSITTLISQRDLNSRSE